MGKREVFKKGPAAVMLSVLGGMLFTIFMYALAVQGIHQAAEANEAEGLRLLEEALMRAVVKCYGVEGCYPEDLAYIEEHYGVYVDRSKYVVYYEIFASNLLPDITVLRII